MKRYNKDIIDAAIMLVESFDKDLDQSSDKPYFILPLSKALDLIRAVYTREYHTISSKRR